MSASPWAEAAQPEQLRRVRSWLSWHPEAPFAVFAAAGWLALALERPTGAGPERSGWICLITVSPGGPSTDLSGLVHLPLMLAAAMVPVTMPWLQHVALASPAKRRVRAMALYLTAFLVAWLAAIAPPAALIALVGATVGGTRTLLPAALILAAIWHLAPARRRALADCVWSVPLAVVGRRADMACLRMGMTEARRCIVTCWALMTVMLVAGANLPVMLSVTAISFASQWTTAGFAYRRPLAAGLAVGALAAGALALLLPG